MGWTEVPLTVNGYEYPARFRQETIDDVLVPLVERLSRMRAERGGRVIAFLAAPPGTGKSTLATMLEQISREREDLEHLQYLGLDGFHHYNEWLDSHTTVRDGREISMRKVKGAPETFDAAHFAEKLAELRAKDVVGWPEYDRNLHDPREDAVSVAAGVVLVEGNWLLLDEDPWRGLASTADYTVFVGAAEADLRERLVARKAKGVGREEAEAHYERSDGPNVRLVLEHSLPADLTLSMTPDGDYVPA